MEMPASSEEVQDQSVTEANAQSVTRKRHLEGATGDTEASEAKVLTDIFHKLGGEKWCRREGWTEAAFPGSLESWQGVGVDEAGRVSSLELSSNNVTGRLEDVVDELLQLSGLQQLWLAENELQGPLPAALASLPALTVLDLGSNKLCGILPPEFAANPRLSWFEISGNQLSSFFRFTETSRQAPPELHSGVASVVPNLPGISPSSLSSAMWHVHTVPRAISPAEANALVAEAERWVAENGGWQIDRHRAYQTTDLDVSGSSPELLRLCNIHLEGSILPLLAKLFGFAAQDLAVEDLFVVKYSALQGEQRSLRAHRDDSELSFVLSLSDPAVEFTGGGTAFLDCDPSVLAAPVAPGTGVFFCGRQLHAGVEITSGTRCILAGFVRLHPSSPVSAEVLRSMEAEAAALKALKPRKKTSSEM